MTRHAALLSLLLAASLSAGCTVLFPTDGWTRAEGMDDASVSDAGTDAYVPDPLRCFRQGGDCNALSNRDCAEDEACYLVPGASTESLQCLLAGARADGAECDMPNHCASGSTCVFGRCLAHCCAYEDCGDTARCVPVIGNNPEGAPFVGVCFANDACDALLQNCSPGYSCVTFEERGIYERVCIPTSASRVPGQACAGFADCPAGTRCRPQGASLVCRRYCDVRTGAPCAGACEPVGGVAPAELGLCVEPPG